MGRFIETLAFAGLIAAQVLALIWARHVPTSREELEALERSRRESRVPDHRARLIVEGGS